MSLSRTGNHDAEKTLGIYDLASQFYAFISGLLEQRVPVRRTGAGGSGRDRLRHDLDHRVSSPLDPRPGQGDMTSIHPSHQRLGSTLTRGDKEERRRNIRLGSIDFERWIRSLHDCSTEAGRMSELERASLEAQVTGGKRDTPDKQHASDSRHSAADKSRELRRHRRLVPDEELVLIWLPHVILSGRRSASPAPLAYLADAAAGAPAPGLRRRARRKSALSR